MPKSTNDIYKEMLAQHKTGQNGGQTQQYAAQANNSQNQGALDVALSRLQGGQGTYQSAPQPRYNAVQQGGERWASATDYNAAGAANPNYDFQTYLRQLQAANPGVGSAGLPGHGIQRPAQTDTATGAQANTNGNTYDWDAATAALWGQINNGAPFSYDAMSDPMYLAAKDQYTRAGQQAMKDTMGQAAALTGGYGNTYGQAVGNQAYNDYLTQLSSLGAEYAQQARAAYDAEGDDLYRRYQLAAQAGDTAYNRSRDALADQRYEDETAYNRSRDAISDQRWQTQWDYNVGRDQIADQRYADETAYNRSRDAISDQRYQQQWDYNVGRDQIADQRYADETAYNRSRDAISDQRYQQQWDYNVGRDQISDQRYNQEYGSNQAMTLLSMGVMPSSEQLAAAGLTPEQANTIMAWYRNGGYSYSGGSGGGGGGGRSYGGGGGGYDYGTQPTAQQTSGNGNNTGWNSGLSGVGGQLAANIQNAYNNALANAQPIPESELEQFALIMANQGYDAGLNAFYRRYPGNGTNVQNAVNWLINNYKRYKGTAGTGYGGSGLGDRAYNLYT